MMVSVLIFEILIIKSYIYFHFTFESEILNLANSNESSTQKQASLLDSTQKHQKTQTIKPKTSSKSSAKISRSNSGNLCNLDETNKSNDQNELNFDNQIKRSPRRYNNEVNQQTENNGNAGRSLLPPTTILNNLIELDN